MADDDDDFDERPISVQIREGVKYTKSLIYEKFREKAMERVFGKGRAKYGKDVKRAIEAWESADFIDFSDYIPEIIVDLLAVSCPNRGMFALQCKNVLKQYDRMVNFYLTEVKGLID
jgi:hypothetical protein